MDDAGDAEFRYEFTYNGPDFWVREIGLDFELPLAFDKLSWDRNAEYSYYPPDHIGRPSAKRSPIRPCRRPFPPAIGPSGWTITRGAATISAARNDTSIRASLTNKEGQGIEVISDGSQHVRATVGTHDDHPQSARLLRRHRLDLPRGLPLWPRPPHQDGRGAPRKGSTELPWPAPARRFTALMPLLSPGECCASRARRRGSHRRRARSSLRGVARSRP